MQVAATASVLTDLVLQKQLGINIDQMLIDRFL
jgi:hypothetical protein